MAVGFMSVCKDVNVDLLNKCFELGPFHGLRVPHPRDITQPGMTETDPNIIVDENDDEEEEEKEECEESEGISE